MNIRSIGWALLTMSSFLMILGGFNTVYAEDKWRPYIDFEFKPGNDRTIGQSDIVIPVAQDEKSLLTANIRTMIADDIRNEFSIGANYRQIYDNSYIIGGYGFYDRRYTSQSNQFNQATFGLEFMSTNWDARLNGYIPFGDKEKLADTGVTPSVTGTTIQLNAFDLVEKAVGGMDIEFGGKIPVLEDTRAYIGVYHFDASGVDNVTGPRARIETRIHDLDFLGAGSRLTLGAEIQHDDARDTQSFAIARLRIPFNGSKKTKNHSVLERRMLDPIIRDVDIITQKNTIITGTEAANVDINGANVQMDNIIFVSASGTVGATGTQDDPTTLDNPLTQAPNTLVIIDGADGSISNEDFTIGTTTYIAGAASDVVLTGIEYSASYNAGGVRPTISDPNFSGNGFIFADNSGIQGLDFQGSTQTLLFNGTSGTSVRDVNIDGTGIRIGIGLQNNTGAFFDDVVVSGATGTGVRFFGTIDDVSGDITASAATFPCRLLGGATVTNSTLLVNGAACP